MTGQESHLAAIDAAMNEAIAEYRVRPPSDIPRMHLYLEMHPPRYRLLMQLVLDLVSRLPKPATGKLRILDIGPRFDVELMHRLMPDVLVDTLGIDPGFVGARDGERRVIFDLNDADLEDRRPEMDRYPLVVMAEVLEHLYMPPSVTLGWVKSLLAPGGYLVVQTPNAVSLPNRLRMLIGKNPFQPLTAERAFPGHKRAPVASATP
jgi:trans-aconitate methyltransferase